MCLLEISKFRRPNVASTPGARYAPPVAFVQNRCARYFGRLAAMVELWTPWWQAGTGKFNDALAEERIAIVSEAGRLLEAHRKASPLLQNRLLEVVYCYCTVMRLYNGDRASDPLGTFAELCRLSAVLARDAHYQLPASALQRAMEGAAGLHNHSWELALGGVQGVLAVLKCPRGLQRAMRDAQRLAQSVEAPYGGRGSA